VSRGFALGAVSVSLVLIGAAGGWVLTRPASPPTGRRQYMGTPSAERARGMESLATSSRFAWPMNARSIEPRILSNLTVTSGPLAITLRQVATTDSEYSLFGPKLPPSARLGPVSLVFQALALDGRTDLDDLWLDPSELVATDDRGATLRPSPMPAALLRSSQIASGCIWSLPLEAPSAGASLLREVRGVLVHRGETPRTYPFRFRDVPLPSAERFFGRVALLYAGEGGPASTSGISLVTTPPRRASVSTSPASGETRFPPLRLVVPAGRSVGLWFAPEMRAPDVTLRAVSGGAGSVAVGLETAGASWRGALWDSEPVLLRLPAGARHRLLRLELSREPFAMAPVPQPPTPFPPLTGTAGGAITGSVRVGSRPMGRGAVSLRLWRLEGSTVDGPIEALVPLDREGAYILPNLAPGGYRMEYEPDTVKASGARGASFTEYVRMRYGIEGGAWSNSGPFVVEVRPGQVSGAPPLVWSGLVPRR
jgi:hypothetical protein